MPLKKHVLLRVDQALVLHFLNRCKLVPFSKVKKNNLLRLCTHSCSLCTQGIPTTGLSTCILWFLEKYCDLMHFSLTSFHPIWKWKPYDDIHAHSPLSAVDKLPRNIPTGLLCTRMCNCDMKCSGVEVEWPHLHLLLCNDIQVQLGPLWKAHFTFRLRFTLQVFPITGSIKHPHSVPLLVTHPESCSTLPFFTHLTPRNSCGNWQLFLSLMFAGSFLCLLPPSPIPHYLKNLRRYPKCLLGCGSIYRFNRFINRLKFTIQQN